MDLSLGPLAQIAFVVTDVDRSEEFYGQTLGLKKIVRRHETMVFFDCGGVRLFLEKASRPEDVGRVAILYFRCDDIAVCRRELESRGVQFEGPPHRITLQPAYDLWTSFFRDPDGHLLALEMHAPKGWKPPKA
jgi:methylmalonyl-CoA/ethylmalonyl-CoA epimerase